LRSEDHSFSQEFVMDGIVMDTKQFFQKMRLEDFQHAEASQVDYRSQMLRERKGELTSLRQKAPWC
jgi:hypothetical protein